MATTQKRTDELVAGDVIIHPEKDSRDYLLPISAAHPGHLLAVASVEPWILTRGPQAGKQATSGRGGSGAPMFVIRVNCMDNRWESSNPVATADRLWTVWTAEMDGCWESTHSHCGQHDAPWQPFADTCDGV